MITTRSAAIRFGVSRNWPVKSAELGFFYSNFDSKVRSFFSDFFSQPVVVGMGVALAGILLHRFPDRFVVEVFLQDSRLLDWLATSPGFSLKRRRLNARTFPFPRKSTPKLKRYSVSRKTFGRFRGLVSFSFLKTYKSNSSQRKLRLRKAVAASLRFKYLRRRRKYFKLRKIKTLRRYFSIRRLHLRAARISALAGRPLSKFLRFKKRRPKGYISKFKKFRRFKKKRRISFFPKPRFFFCSKFFREFSNFSRFRFFKFFGKFASFLGFQQLGIPIFFRLNFIGKIGTAQFHLNYITTKLYYRYILNDVINPIVRLSLRYYRGFRIVCRGRFTRAQMATERVYRRGSLRLSSMAIPVDYAQKSVVLKYGVCNLKIWLRY